MGGDLTVTSRYGRGASFRLSAVLAIATAAAAANAPQQPPAAPAPPLAVLCAEDNPYGRVILNTILTELGHRADFVGSGEEAVAAVARGYDAVLVDVTLPGIDGRETTRRIRALAGTAGHNTDHRHYRPQRDRRRGCRAPCRHERLSAQADQPERARRSARGGGAS